MKAPTRRPTRHIQRPNGRRPHTPECFRVAGRAGERAPDRNGHGPAQPDLTKLVPYVRLAFMHGDSPQLSSGARLVDWVYVDDVV
jgi:hypothetical protein